MWVEKMNSYERNCSYKSRQVKKIEKVDILLVASVLLID